MNSAINLHDYCDLVNKTALVANEHKYENEPCGEDFRIAIDKEVKKGSKCIAESNAANPGLSRTTTPINRAKWLEL